MSFSMRSFSRVVGEIAPIIGVLMAALAMGGCSAVRLGYNTSPTLVYWWLDSYFDFDSDQSARVRDDLQSVQEWHRKNELPLLEKSSRNCKPWPPRP